MSVDYPSGWITPKVDWDPSDAPTDVDFNRIESNAVELVELFLSGEAYFKLNGTVGGSNPGLIRWKRVNDTVTIYLPEFTDTSNSISMNMFPTTADLGVTGDEEWPVEILAKDYGNYPVKTQIIGIDDGNLFPALIELPRTITSSLVCYVITPTSGEYQSNVWSNTGLKGFDSQNFSYIGG